MIELTGNQKRFLRATAQRFRCLVNIGKAGLTPGIIGQINVNLDSHELIKVRLANEIEQSQQELIDQIASQTASACAGTVGRTAIFYRPSRDEYKAGKIKLP